MHRQVISRQTNRDLILTHQEHALRDENQLGSVFGINYLLMYTVNSFDLCWRYDRLLVVRQQQVSYLACRVASSLQRV